MKKSLCTLALALCCSPITTNAYTDVASTQWHYPYITAMSEMGLMDGYPDNTFKPDNQLTLAEFSVLLSNAFYGTSLHMVGQETFDDWWEPYIYTCRLRDGLVGTEIGEMIQTYTDNGYRFNQYTQYANEPLTRFDVATMVTNLLIDNYVTSPSNVIDVLDTLPDVSLTSPYGEAVATACYHGIMYPTDEGLFNGSGIITRAEVSVVLKALVECTEVSLELRSDAETVLASPAYNMSSYNHTGNLAIENYVFARVNELRSALGLDTVTANSTLLEYAYIRAQETEENWAHIRPDGSQWSTVISPTDTENTLTGENLTMGSGFRTYEYPDMIFKSWINSQSHYLNMISATHKELGLAVYVNDNESYYATQIFGVPNTSNLESSLSDENVA